MHTKMYPNICKPAHRGRVEQGGPSAFWYLVYILYLCVYLGYIWVYFCIYNIYVCGLFLIYFYYIVVICSLCIFNSATLACTTV